jgi:hypothetical protein
VQAAALAGEGLKVRSDPLNIKPTVSKTKRRFICDY